MPINVDYSGSTGQKMLPTLSASTLPSGKGPNIYHSGPFCHIATPMPALHTSTTATSLITGAVTTGFGTAPTIVKLGSGASSDVLPYSGTYRIPGNWLQAGTRLAFKGIAIMASGSNPTMALSVGFQNATTGTYTALADTTALASSSPTGTVGYLIEGYIEVPAAATDLSAATLNSFVMATWGPTGTKNMAPWAAVASIDLTADNFFDIRFTWGTSDAGNTITLKDLVLSIEA